MQPSDHLRRFRGGALFLLVIHTFALFVGIVHLAGGAPNSAQSGLSMIAAALFIFIPALMVWNASRFGGVLLVMIMAAEVVINLMDGTFLDTAMIRAVLYLGLSIWMVREVSRYRRTTIEAGQPIGGSAIIRWSGTVLAALLGGFALLGLADSVMPAPVPSEIQTARQIPSDQYRWMYENKILGRKERVFLFAPDSGKSYADGGNILTNQYVGGWWREEDGELESVWIKLGEICRVEESKTSQDVPETLYTIRSFNKGSWLRIALPKEQGGDRVFLARMNYLNDQNMHREVRAACEENRDPDWDMIAASNGIEPDIVGPDEIDADHLTWMRHNKFLTHEEKILKFYSAGHYSIAASGLLLTDNFFGGWTENTDGLQSWWFELGEICGVSKEEDGTETEGPLYKIESKDNWFQFQIPDAGDQDVEFIEQLKQLSGAAHTSAQKQACADMQSEKSDAAKEAAILSDAG